MKISHKLERMLDGRLDSNSLAIERKLYISALQNYICNPDNDCQGVELVNRSVTKEKRKGSHSLVIMETYRLLIRGGDRSTYQSLFSRTLKGFYFNGQWHVYLLCDFKSLTGLEHIT